MWSMSQSTFNYQPFWEEAVSRLRETLPKTDFVAYFSRINYEKSRQDTLVLSVPSQFILEQVEKQFKEHIANTVSELTGENIKVEFVIKKMNSDQLEGLSKLADQADAAAPFRRESASAGEPPVQAISVTESARAECGLNQKYEFDTFISGDNSSFAYNACCAIAKNPGVTYNPCLIYGGVGLGKTHLLQSIGNYIIEHSPNLKVFYVTAEMFTNEFIHAISEKKTNAFKRKYRRMDVLLIDDIHFLQGKDSTQEELFHTFNNLYETNKQLVFTCDRPISELKDLTARLRSRFERGLNVDLQPPNYETRMAILRLKCEEQSSHMSDEVLDYICRNVETNVRDLEAALTKMVAYSKLMGREITMEIVQEQLKPASAALNRSQSTSIDSIIKHVSEHFNLSPYDMRSKKRNKSLALPRMIAMYIAREITDFSTTEIGMEFGGKDHTTVIYAIGRVQGLVKSDPVLSGTISQLERDLQAMKK